MVEGQVWYVYIVQCSDHTLYTGVTTDVERRVAEHNGAGGPTKGAKYTKVRRPVRLAYSEVAADRGAAQRREATLRTLTRSEKLMLIKSNH